MKPSKVMCNLLALLIASAISISQTKINGFFQYSYLVEFKNVRKETFIPGTINLRFSNSLAKQIRLELQVGLKEMDFNKFLKDYFIEIFDPILGLKGLEIKAGQFKYYWSIERKESSSDRRTVYRSQVVSALVADRDRGVEVSYTGLKNFRFALGVWNGEVVYKNAGTVFETIDYTRNMDDSDTKKDLTAFASYDLKISSGNELTINAGYLNGSNGRMGIAKKIRYGFGFDGHLVNKNLHFRGEFIGGEDDNIKKLGYYLQLSYKIFDYFEPVLKYDLWDSNINLAGESKWLTFGVYSKVMEYLVFRFNYVRKIEETVDIKNDEVVFMIQVKF
jgi:hypothetical protein